jgi:uncharacterized SAM-binding protein YcdF (DUF218 family)
MYHFFVALLQPYTLMVLLVVLTYLFLWRRRSSLTGRTRWVLILAMFPLAALVSISTPAVAYLALGSLEWRYHPVAGLPAESDVLVVLGGGILPPDRVRNQAELGTDSVARCLYASELYHEGVARKAPVKIVVSGGRIQETDPGPTIAEAMGDLLVELGVSRSDLILERASRTTYENAAESRRILESLSAHKVVLVTEAYHMFRGVKCFRAQGIDVVPAACGQQATEFGWHPEDFLPDPKAAYNCQLAAHEWLGTFWYWLHGRIG